jgi:hypothetical protein
VLRTFGVELANKVFPQFHHENGKGTSRKSNEHTDLIVDCALKQIGEHGYTTEKQIINQLGFMNYKWQATAIQIKKSIQEILGGYGLARVRVNKSIKEKFGIDDTIGYGGFIIVAL